MRKLVRLACLGSALVAAAAVACSSDETSPEETPPAGNEAGTPDSGGPSPDTGASSETGTQPDQQAPDADVDADAGPKCKTATCAIAIAAGPWHTCAILGDHTVKCWGDNAHGELASSDAGVIAPPQSDAPVVATGIVDAVMIAAGGDPNASGFTCALIAGGAIRCWGSNNLGQLGASTDASTSPNAVTVVTDASASTIDLGYRHGCMIDTAGSLRCWGANTAGDRGVPALSAFTLPTDGGLTQVSAGLYTTCVATTNGQAICFGTNGSGQTNPFNPASPTPPHVLDAGGPVSAVSLTAGFGCADVEGGVSCWGSNNVAQLGRTGTANTFVAPGPPGFAPGIAPVHVVTGGNHACAIMEDQSVACWGYNSKGQTAAFGGQSTVPTPNGVGGLGKVVQIALGNEHSCSLNSEGDIYCWGSNSKGQIGPNDAVDGSFDTAAHPDAVKVPL